MDKSPLRPDAVPGAAELPARAARASWTRSISSLAAVQAARVHLALPNQNGFFREQQKPSASVLLTLHPGRTLDRAQVAGIVHLVSSSVPELSPKAVSVLDGSGALLSGADDSRQGPGRAAAAVRAADRGRLPEARARDPRAGASAATTCAPTSPPTSTSRRPSRPREEFKPNQGDAPAAVQAAAAQRIQPARRGRAQRRAGCGQQPAAGAGDGTGQPAARSRCRRRRAATAAAACAATPSPSTRWTRRCA